MSVPKPKLHSALTADETREAIILDFSNQLRSKLISAGLEGSHTTFVNAEWVGGVRVKAFLRKPIDVKVVGSIGEQGESGEELEASASVGRVIKNPETVRGELKGVSTEQVHSMDDSNEKGTEETTSQMGALDKATKESEFPLTDVVEKRDVESLSFKRVSALHSEAVAQGPEPYIENVGDATAPYEPPNFVTEEPFTLLNGEPPKNGVDLSGIESEIVETHDTFVDDVAEALKDVPLESVLVPNASALCQFCSTPLSDYPPAKISHMRTHVRKGEAIEFTDGNGEKAWRPNE